MKRCILGLVLGLGVALLAVGAQPPSVALAGDDPRYCDQSSGDIHNSSHVDWMKWLPDDMNLTELSLPGTHDSMSRKVGAAGELAKTQSATLQRQLDAGIRVLDIRARHIGNHFTLHHGSAHFGVFGVDVLVPVGQFLAANPTETIVMRLGDSGVPDPKDNTRDYHETFEWYRDYTWGGQYIWEPDPTSNPAFPDLGDVRGKIVILQDFAAPSYYGPRWPEEGTFVNDRFDIQDDYQIECWEFDEKWREIREHLSKTNNNFDPTKMYVNHLSGVGTVPLMPTPGQVACGGPIALCLGYDPTGMNEEALAYLFEGNVQRTGALMMDYPGAGLIDAIIAHNMRYATGLPKLSTDFTTMFSNIAYSADNFSDGQDDEALDRLVEFVGGEIADGKSVSGFLPHILPGNLWVGAVMRGEYGRAFHPFLSANWPWGSQTADNYLHVAYRVESCSYYYDHQVVLSLLAFMLPTLSGSAQARADELASWLGDYLPRQNWTVLVKHEGGFKNWASIGCPGLYFRLHQVDYAYDVYGYNANYPPQANAGGPYTGQEGSAVTFDGSGSSDPNGKKTLQYRWDFHNDGTWDTGWSSAPSASYTWSNQYSGTVKVEVRDEVRTNEFYPPTSVDTATVTVSNAPPEITATGDTVNENGVATVSGTITDPGSADTFTVEIDWGEGAPDTFNYPAGATSYSETHQYLDDNPTGTASDDYAVTVTVTDDDGGSDTAGTTVSVNNVNPVVTIDSIADENGWQVGVDVDVVLTNTVVEVAASFTDVGTLDTHTASIDWGDGSVEDLGPVTGSISATHTYSDPCDCTITLTVTDDDTGPGTATAQIAVVDASGGINDVIDDLTPYGDDRDVAKAIAKLRGEKGGHASNGALDMLEKDDLNAALEKIKQALEYLEAAEAADPGLDFTNEKGVLSLAGKSVAVGAIEQAEAAAAEPSELQKVQQARDLVAEGDALLAGGDYVGAVGKYEQAARKVQGIA